jgi:hypothetical protein
MKDLDKPKESPEQRATRMWGNHDLTKRFLEEKMKAPPVLAPKPTIQVIENERLKAEETTKFERKFIKDLRVMLEGRTQRNLLEYRLALRARIKRLKFEKLKRLLAQREHGAPQC